MYLTEKKDDLHPIHLPSHYFADTTHSFERVHNSTIQPMEYFAIFEPYIIQPFFSTAPDTSLLGLVETVQEELEE